MNPWPLDEAERLAALQSSLARRGGARKFDEYFRCYPIAMLPGPDRPDTNHGGKVFLPPSALDKLTRLHIMYPMLFELRKKKGTRTSHSGVLEFIAEEGKIYLPFWLMETLLVEPGDLVQVQSTELPLGTHVKFQPQDPAFLEISDPKAVLQKSLNNLPCLTTGDIFTFEYNDTVYSIAVLEVKPDSPKKSICIIDVDLNVDFAPPVGYDENAIKRRTPSGTSTPRSTASGVPTASGTLHPHGPMAQAIGYAAIKPSSDIDPLLGVDGGKGRSHFVGVGNRIAPRKGKGKAVAKDTAPEPENHAGGPMPLRLPPGKLFLGYEIKPVRKKEGGDESEKKESVHFQGQGQSLRKGKGKKDGGK